MDQVAKGHPIPEGLVERLEELLGPLGGEITLAHGEVSVTIPRDKIVEVVSVLRDDSRLEFISIIDVCGVDWPDRDERFDVVYHFLSPRQNARIRVKLSTDEDNPVASITGLFPGADWFEREAYDMYGILFTGHPDLRRILTDYGFEGYPLRKEFPLTGHVQVRYDEEQKRVVYEPVNVKQEFREFDFGGDWQMPQYDLPNEDVGADKKS